VTVPHPIQRRYLAEQIVRLRRADEEERYAFSQRQGRIDPNPHQIDAVIFALKRIPEGGCILADEVGLGKTIEAGLVIAQLRAEGAASRVLLIVPKPLLGQWQDELYRLFGIQAAEKRLEPGAFAGEGVFLIGRETAGSERGAAILRDSEPFDLCVIDEAHEIFASIYRRYDKEGIYRTESLLSIGTRDQLSTIFRLTLAEQLNSAVVLDDQLTQSDPTRMVWLRDLLRQIAKNIQVIVFTCRPEDYLIPLEMQSGADEDKQPPVHCVDLVRFIDRSSTSPGS
jgi:hypothetical protein